MFRRKQNRIFKRVVLGFAVAAFVVPSTAIAAVDEGGAGQPNKASEGYVPFVTDFPKYELQQSAVKAGDYGMPRAMPSDYAAAAVESNISIENVRLQPRTTSSDVVVNAGDYGVMPRMIDLARQRGDAIEVARTHPRNVVTADIENVRLQPRTTSTPELVSTGFDWGDAGVGAGFVVGLLLIGGAAFYGTRHLGKVQTA